MIIKFQSLKTSKITLFIRQFKSSLVYILLTAAAISLIMGDITDAGFIFLAVLINVVVGFYQENKAQKALESLQKVVVDFAQVLRDGQKQKKETRTLVPGDLVFLEVGDKVPADLRILQVTSLKINEAPLTGESIPVEKNDLVLSGDLILADRTNMAFMGTQVTEGKGFGVVVGTGAQTYIGHIANLVNKGDEIITPLQHKLNAFSKKISFIILLICLFILALGLFEGQGFTEIFTTAVAVAVSAIPEGLLVVVTMILALGMHRILKKKALTKNLLAAETLGSTSVICTDKTGTLTEGEMRVVEISTWDYDLKLSEQKKEAKELLLLLKIGAICNNAYIENPDEELEHRIIRGTPTEKALLIAADTIGLDKNKLENEEGRLDEKPFDSKWKYMITLNKNKLGNTFYIKGAPEVLLDKCKYIFSKNSHLELTADKKKELDDIYKNMSRRGLRVLAVGYKDTDKDVKKIDNNVDNNDFIFVGFLGIKDPIRPGILETLKEVQKAGIKVVMITGDHKLTAKAIAAELEIPCDEENILSGEELKNMSESRLLKVIKNITVYARVTPEDKLKIVKAWQEKGEVVAMTGDGINDAPALKRANIGIAVGSGTDVAKETADMILLNNNFKTIRGAIKEGRTIYDNIKKVILYFLSDGLAEVLIIVVSLLLGWPLPLLAAQIIWINLVDDAFPSIAMTREPADKDIMKDKPRKINEPILNNEAKFLIILISCLSAIGTLFFFKYFLHTTNNIELARTIGFTFLAVSTLVYVFSIRNLKRPFWRTDFLNNKFLIGGVSISFTLQVLAIYNPWLQKILQTVPLTSLHWVVIISGCLILVLLIESVKALYNKHTNNV